MEALREALVVVILVVVATAVLKVSAHGGEASIHALVVEFQTLIAGFLAIVAAYITVRQMRESDRRSDQRHEDLMRLQLRADGLKLDRAFFAVVPALREIREFLNSAPPFEIRNDQTFYEDVEAYRETANKIARLADRAAEGFRAEPWKGAEDLFGGALGASVKTAASELYRLRSVASLAVTTTKPDPEMAAIYPSGSDRYWQLEAQTIDRVKELPAQIGRSNECVASLILTIERLSHSYQLR